MAIDPKFRSIVDDLDSYIPNKNKELFIEGRGQQVITSALNLINLLETSYPKEIADDLTRRMILAIKNNDMEKFIRRVRHIRERKEKKNE